MTSCSSPSPTDPGNRHPQGIGAKRRTILLHSHRSRLHLPDRRVIALAIAWSLTFAIDHFLPTHVTRIVGTALLVSLLDRVISGFRRPARRRMAPWRRSAANEQHSSGAIPTCREEPQLKHEL